MNCWRALRILLHQDRALARPNRLTLERRNFGFGERPSKWSAWLAAAAFSTLTLWACGGENPGTAHSRSVTTPPATATPAPSLLRISVSNSPFPATYKAPVLLFQISGETQLRAISWDASTSGVVAGQLAGGMSAQSSDGLRYIAGGTVYDRRGQALGALPWPGKDNSATFSTDGQLLCKAAPETRVTGSVMRLEAALPGQAPRIVASGFTIYGDNATYPVLACDVATDRAIVAVLGQGVEASKVWVFRLSTGTILRTYDYSQTGAWVVAAADGSMLAESVTQGNGQIWTTTIRHTDDGVQLGMLNDFVAHGFSSDNARLVGQTKGGNLTVMTNWRSGQQIWSSTGLPGGYGGVFAEPGGGHLAIGLGFVGGSDQGDVYLVASDGSAVLLPAHCWPVLQY